MASNYLYVLVSSSSWDRAGMKYRRHRLLDYLLKQNNTIDAIWVYPASSSFRKPGKFNKAKKTTSNNPTINSYNIKEWALPDYLPGRIMQYKSSYGHPQAKKLANYINRYNAKKVLWYNYPAFPYLSNSLDWDIIVYDCTDLWTKTFAKSKSKKFSSLFIEGLIESAEKKVIDNSKIIFASSLFLAKRVENLSGRQAILIENGVDDVFFNKTSKSNNKMMENIPMPRLGYVGVLKEKIDIELLDETASKKPDWSIVLIGPTHIDKDENFQLLIMKDNVYWLGASKADNLPGLISELDVGLLPYKEIEYNEAVFPIKFFEYLSRSLPVVGCGVPSTKIYSQKGVYIHVKREKFVDACTEVLSNPVWSENEYIFKRKELAKNASWDKKFAKMLNIIREV